MKYQENYDPSALERAKKRVEELKGFYWHLAVFAVFNTFNFLNYFIGLEWSEHMELWIVLLIFFAWGVGLTLHAWHVFGTYHFLGAEWEERKIREFMNEEAQHSEEGERKQDKIQNI